MKHHYPDCQGGPDCNCDDYDMDNNDSEPTIDDCKIASLNKKADEILANGKAIAVNLGISFSGTDCAGSPRGDDWLAFTDGEYYHQIRKIMLDYGMGEGDV
jgi:hypothetical protein